VRARVVRPRDGRDPAERVRVQALDRPDLVVGQRLELLRAGPPRQAPLPLPQEVVQQMDRPVRHVHQLLDRRGEPVERLQVGDLVREVPLDRLRHAPVQELGVRRRVEVAVVVRGVVQDLDVVVRRGAPVDAVEERLRVRPEHAPVLLDAPQHHRADREDHPGRVEPRDGELVLDQPPVHPPVSIHEWMDVDEAERHRRGRDHRIEPSSRRAAVVGDEPIQQRGQILWPGADVLRDRLPGDAVPGSDEAPRGPEPERDETGIPDHQSLKPLELLDREFGRPGLRDGAGPALGPRARWMLALDLEGCLGVAQ